MILDIITNFRTLRSMLNVPKEGVTPYEKRLSFYSKLALIQQENNKTQERIKELKDDLGISNASVTEEDVPEKDIWELKGLEKYRDVDWEMVVRMVTKKEDKFSKNLLTMLQPYFNQGGILNSPLTQTAVTCQFVIKPVSEAIDWTERNVKKVIGETTYEVIQEADNVIRVILD